MTALREAAEQALRALEKATGWMSDADYRRLNDSIAALRAALAQEPQTTHSDECWRWHHACAVAEIERLRGDKKCRHPDSCERDADGYCAKCHEEMR